MLLKLLFLYLLVAITVQSAPIQERGLKDTLLRISGMFTGKATFFRPKEEGGDIGACGPHEDNNSKIVALNLPQFGNQNKMSKWCFKKVLIRAGKKSTKATITDACPGCQEKSLDLTPAVFQQLASPEIGVIDIDWCVIGTDGCDDEGDEGDEGGKKKKKN